MIEKRELAFKSWNKKLIGNLPRNKWLVEHLEEGQGLLLTAAVRQAFYDGYTAATKDSEPDPRYIYKESITVGVV